MFYYLILDASHSNACATCDSCKRSHVIADAATSTSSACACAYVLDANDLTINVVDIDSCNAFNTPSPIVLRNKKAAGSLDDERTVTTATRKQTRSKLAQHRKSLSESDLLNEIDNALVFSKGFLYSHGK